MFVIFIQFSISLFSQEDNTLVINDSIKNKEIFDIATKPSKAAFYSAILPGLGQAYNKDYWKVPLVYGALGTSIYAYKFNNDAYKKFRKAYKLNQLGLENDYPFATSQTLERAQKYHKKNRDLSTLVTVGLYMLQIVEASVDAHLKYHDTEPDLSFSPVLIQEPFSQNTTLGIGFSYTF